MSLSLENQGKIHEFLVYLYIYMTWTTHMMAQMSQMTQMRQMIHTTVIT